MEVPSLREVALAWGRIGVTGFGGPPAHIELLRGLCVRDREWIDDESFEQAMGATSLLPGPASTQLAIYCAWRVRAAAGALIGGACFIVPGLIAILALSALFLAGSPPSWVRGAAAGAGAAVPAVAVRAGLGVAGPIWQRARAALRVRVAAYGLAGGVSAALIGPWLVLTLLGCGALETALARSRARYASDGAGSRSASSADEQGVAPTSPQERARRRRVPAMWPIPLALTGTGGIPALAWTALKVGALSFGGGFVIVPLMQSDAVSVHHWMSGGEFLTAVALGQVTPGPVVLTVAAVGYAAGGVGAGLLAALVAFAPSFAFVLAGAGRLQRLLGDPRARAFLAGAAPAAAGAIVGAAIPLAGELGVWWQGVILAGAAIALLVMRAGVVEVLVAAAVIGAVGAVAGASLPS